MSGPFIFIHENAKLFVDGRIQQWYIIHRCYDRIHPEPIKWRDRGYGRRKPRQFQTKGEASMEQKEQQEQQEHQYLMASQIAQIYGGKWTRTRVHTYLKRGQFPEPVMYVGNQPFWTPEQVEREKKRRGIK